MALTQTQVSELYVAIFNRASEQEGNNHWQGAESATQAANDMLATDAAKQYFGTSLDSNQAFIEHIYFNTLDKTYADDAEGIDFWVSALDAGTSRGEIVASLVAAIAGAEDGPAKQQFENRVEVSNYVADNLEGAPDNYMQALGFSGDLTVTSNPGTINSAKKAVQELAVETGETSTLTEALVALQKAKEGVAAFLKDALNNKAVAAEVNDDTAEAAAPADVNKVYGAAITALNATMGGLSVNADGSDNLNNATIAEAETILGKAVTKALKDVNETTGLKSAVDGLGAAQEGLAEAHASQGATAATAAAAAAAFQSDALSGTASTFSTSIYATGTTSVPAVLYDSDGSGTELKITYDGKNFKAEGTEKDSSYAKDLLEAIKADVAALMAVEQAATGLAGALAEVLVLEDDYELGTDLTGADAFTILRADGTTFDDAGASDQLVTHNGKLYLTDSSTIASATKFTEVVVEKVAYKNTSGVVAIDTADNAGGISKGGILVREAGEAIDATSDATLLATLKSDAEKLDAKAWPITADEMEVSGLIDVTTAVKSDELKSDSYLDGADGTGAATVLKDTDSLAYLSAVAAEKGFEAALDAYLELKDLALELKGLEAAVEAAREAITDEDEGLGIKLLEDGKHFTSGDDVYLFTEADHGKQLNNFGFRGDDKIYFGEGFTGGLVEIEQTKDDNGDVSALEIFWTQAGANVELYVEQKTFAGNGSTDNDMVKIILTGVKGDDLSLTDDGFLTIA